MYEILKKKIFQYFIRILLFLVVFHIVVRPVQTAFNNNIIAPIIVKKLKDMNPNLALYTLKNHTKIQKTINKKKRTVLSFSMPFGQFYFFLIFFLWFKPPLLIRALSFYNIMLIPAYIIAVFMFLRGYEIFGNILILNEKIFRLIYFFIFSLKVFRPKQFKVIFSG